MSTKDMKAMEKVCRETIESEMRLVKAAVERAAREISTESGREVQLEDPEVQLRACELILLDEEFEKLRLISS